MLYVLLRWNGGLCCWGGPVDQGTVCNSCRYCNRWGCCGCHSALKCNRWAEDRRWIYFEKIKFCFLLGLVPKTNPSSVEGTNWHMLCPPVHLSNLCQNAELMWLDPHLWWPFQASSCPSSRLGLALLLLYYCFTTVLMRARYYCVVACSWSQVRITYESSSDIWLLSVRFVTIPNPEDPNFVSLSGLDRLKYPTVDTKISSCLLWSEKVRVMQKTYMSVGVMKD